MVLHVSQHQGNNCNVLGQQNDAAGKSACVSLTSRIWILDCMVEGVLGLPKDVF